MRAKFKAWAEPFINEHSEVMIDETGIINFSKPFNLEIGSGKGAFLIGLALKFPKLNFIGVERNVTCCGFTAKKLVESEIKNAKLFFGNADQFLFEMKDNFVDNIFLNFSDPWPKKRHEKRRLTANKYLDKYYAILKKGGHLYIKTDNVDLFTFTKENLESSKFVVESITDDYQELDDFDFMSEYESSFRNEGVKINRLVLRK